MNKERTASLSSTASFFVSSPTERRFLISLTAFAISRSSSWMRVFIFSSFLVSPPFLLVTASSRASLERGAGLYLACLEVSDDRRQELVNKHTVSASTVPVAHSAFAEAALMTSRACYDTLKRQACPSASHVLTCRGMNDVCATLAGARTPKVSSCSRFTVSDYG